MGTTNVANEDRILNSYTDNFYSENSGIQKRVYVNTGNKERKNGLPVYNDTYTLSTGAVNKEAETNAKLLNWDDVVIKKGKELNTIPGVYRDVTIEEETKYEVVGHPDKFIYDYQQNYGNCGVDSCLNLLGMAGLKDIIEKGGTYKAWDDANPLIKTVKERVYNEETGTWDVKTETKRVERTLSESEDEFLLWALKNSPNDSAWYDDMYKNNIPLDGNIPIINSGEITDYVVHSKNLDLYSSIEDLKANPLEVGGTNAIHRDNILKYWGLKSDYEEASAVDFINKLSSLVDEGKGIIVGGYAKTFINESGGGHAISVIGYLRDSAKNVLGFYVIDTGGFISDGHTSECAQFVSNKAMYDFLTNNGEYDTYQLNYTLENIRSWADDLNLKGNDRKNTLEGNESSNYIWAGKSNDVLYGAGGNDFLYGEEHNDTLHGGQGNDVLVGGSGNDMYIFQSSDYMEDGASDIKENAKGSHDYLIVGQGKDSIQFDTQYSYDFYYNLDDNGAPIYELDINGLPIYELDKKGNPIHKLDDDGNPIYAFIADGPISSQIITPIEEMEYLNKNGNLVINYTITNIDSYDQYGTPLGIKYNNNSITVENYFSKQLYNSIQTIRETQTEVDVKGYQPELKQSIVNEFNFIKDVLATGYIKFYSEQEKNNTLKGTKFMDSIIAGNKNDVITGGAGNDIINGGASNDTIKAGDNNDIIYGSYGNDKIYGEKGDDIIKYQRESDEENFAGGEYGGHDTIYSGSGYDAIELYDYKSNELTFTKANKDLVISYKAKTGGSKTGGSITIANYFSKKGNTSIKALRLSDGTISLHANYNDILEMLSDGEYKYDTLKAGAEGEELKGGLGHDVLYGGKGDDKLIGGLGSDKLYGKAGNNTYIFDSNASGEDTIYTSGNGKTILDFRGSDIIFDTKGANGAINEYSFTKDKNDLIINYATAEDYSDSDNALIRISNYFKSKGEFEIISSNDTDGENPLNLKEEATVYMNGDNEKKNKITGSVYNDLIIGYEYNDTLNGGKGNDTLIGGLGNDNLTGGAGSNVIRYTKGDGLDTINLTKGEKLSIELTGFEINTKLDKEGNPPTKEIFDYEIVKKDLVITWINKDGQKEQLLKLKNFGSKDIIGTTGSVKLYNNGEELMDLRLGYYLDKVINFTSKKYSYTGKWQSEIIDTRALNGEDDIPPKNRGAKVNAGAGNDIIYGSDYNDTLNGGDGDDIIYGSYGVNKLDGGKGSDTYHLFDKTISETQTYEITTIKDTGKLATDVDKAYIHSSLSDIQTSNIYKNIWFNVKANGTYTTTFNVAMDGNSATITGVENIIVNDTTTNTMYKYNYQEIAGAVANWLTSDGRNYKDVNAVMKSYNETDINSLLGLFTNTNAENGYVAFTELYS